MNDKETIQQYSENQGKAHGPNRANEANESNSPQPFLPKKGNYRGLLVYQKAECLYNITFYFAPSKDRTVDQVVQAARSAKQNIAEDYMKDIELRSPESICNIAITLIHQYDKMMERFLSRLQKDFVEKGGIREQMNAARLGYRNDQKAEIARLQAENTQLKVRVAGLEAMLGQKGGEQ